ncbi:MAG: branched-chain amino acid ABC transporter permease, partial [Bacteroidales bacterium]|nr:branched-chain amino acid ABC transporter permease [Bacteroidales bacterium]
SAIFCLRSGPHPIIAIFRSQCLSALITWGIGVLVLRLRGHYLAIATLSFAMIVEVLLRELGWLTGALQGLSGIPSISLGGFIFDTDMSFYYLVWPVTLLLLLFALNLVNSRMGRVFRAIREDEGVAAIFGADVRKYKVKLFIISSVYASTAGSLFAHYVTYISPAAGSIMFAIEIILVIAIGGYTMIWGAMLGVLAISYLNEYLAFFAEYKRTVYGIALIVIMIFFPNGIFHGFKTSAVRLLKLAQRNSEQ